MSLKSYATSWAPVISYGSEYTKDNNNVHVDLAKPKTERSSLKIFIIYADQKFTNKHFTVPNWPNKMQK